MRVLKRLPKLSYDEHAFKLKAFECPEAEKYHFTECEVLNVWALYGRTV